MDEAVLKTMIESIVHGPVMEQLTKTNLEGRIGNFLQEKVNRQGDTQYTNWGGSPDKPRLLHIVENEIKNIIERSAHQVIQQDPEALQENLVKILSEDHKLARCLATTIVSKLSDVTTTIRLTQKG